MKLELEVNTKEEAEKLIKQLQEFVEEKNETLYPDVEKGNMFYIIDKDEEVCGLNYYSFIDKFDKKDLANIYKTQEIAQKALAFKKSRKVWNFIENWAMHNSSFVPNWRHNRSKKYSVYYSHHSEKWVTTYDLSDNHGAIPLSETEAKKLIEILNSSDEYKLS